MLRFSSCRQRVSRLRPKAKTWEDGAVLKAVASTYGRNPMEINPLLSLNVKMVNTNPMGPAERASRYENIQRSEIDGREYAESLLMTSDVYTEETSMGGTSPLPGFHSGPRLASEPNLPFLGHRGRWSDGAIHEPPSATVEDGKYASHPMNLTRLISSRQQHFEMRQQIRSIEALEMAISSNSYEDIINLLDPPHAWTTEYKELIENYNTQKEELVASMAEDPEASEKLDQLKAELELSKESVTKHSDEVPPIVEVVNPLVRTHLPLDDFTPQSAYDDTSKVKILRDKTGNPVTKYPDELLIKACYSLLFNINPHFYEMTVRRQDTIFEHLPAEFTKRFLTEYLRDAAFRPFRQSVTGKVRLSTEYVDGEEGGEPKQQMVYHKIKKALDSLENYSQVATDVWSIKVMVNLTKLAMFSEEDAEDRRQFLEAFDLWKMCTENQLNITAYEALLKSPPHYMMAKEEDGQLKTISKMDYLNGILTAMAKHGVKPRIQTYNSILEVSSSFAERASIFESMRNDGIEPSIYSYSLYYESLFDLMTHFNPEDTNVVYNEKFKEVLDTFWANFEQKRFLMSGDTRDCFALFRMMDFVCAHYVKNVLADEQLTIVRSNPEASQGIGEELNLEHEKYLKVDDSEMPLAIDEANRIMNFFKRYSHSEFCVPMLQPIFFQSFVDIGIDHIHRILCGKIDYAAGLLNDSDGAHNADVDKNTREMIQNSIQLYKDEILNTFTETSQYIVHTDISGMSDESSKICYQYINGHPALANLLTPVLLKLLKMDKSNTMMMNMYNVSENLSPAYQASVHEFLSARNAENDGTNKHLAIAYGSGRKAYTFVHTFMSKSASYVIHNTSQAIKKLSEKRAIMKDLTPEEIQQAYMQDIHPDIREIGEALVGFETTVRVLIVTDIESQIMTSANFQGGRSAPQSGKAVGGNKRFLLTEYLNQLALTGQLTKAIELLGDFGLQAKSKARRGELAEATLDLTTNDLDYILTAILVFEDYKDSENLERLLEIAQEVNQRHVSENNHHKRIVIQKAYYEDITKKYIINDNSTNILKSLVKEEY